MDFAADLSAFFYYASSLIRLGEWEEGDSRHPVTVPLDVNQVGRV